MRDDSWKDSYDDWKLSSPYDEYDESECGHDDYDLDSLDGRCHCYRCGKSWWASDRDIVSLLDAQAAYDRYQDEQNRRQWWSDLLYSVRHPLQTVHWQLQKRGWLRPRMTTTDDEIPF